MTDLLLFLLALGLAVCPIVLGFIAGMAFQIEKHDRAHRGGANAAPASH